MLNIETDRKYSFKKTFTGILNECQQKPGQEHKFDQNRDNYPLK